MERTHTQDLLFETLIGIGLIAVIMTVIMFFYSQLTYTAKKLVLESELQNLKMALEVYKSMKETYPNNLKELVEVLGKDKKYYLFLRIDEQGYPTDPFGNKFVYDKENYTIKVKPRRSWK